MPTRQNSRSEAARPMNQNPVSHRAPGTAPVCIRLTAPASATRRTRPKPARRSATITTSNWWNRRRKVGSLSQRCAQHEADIGEREAPRPRSEKGVDLEFHHRHPRESRGKGDEGADHRKQPADEDGDRAVAGKEPLGVIDLGMADQHVGAPALEAPSGRRSPRRNRQSSIRHYSRARPRLRRRSR